MLVCLMDGLVLLTLAPKVPHPRKPLSPGQTGTVGDSAVRPPNPCMIWLPTASLTSVSTSLASSTPDTLVALLGLGQPGHTPASERLHLPLPPSDVNTWLISSRSVPKCHLVSVTLCDHQGTGLSWPPFLPPFHVHMFLHTAVKVTFQQRKLIMSVS